MRRPRRRPRLRLVPTVRDLHFAWEETAQQRLDEQKEKMRGSVRAALANWARTVGEGADYTDNTPAQCLHPVGHWFEIPNLIKNGTLAALRTAFSRDGPGKVYVQHRIKEDGEILRPLLLAGTKAGGGGKGGGAAAAAAAAAALAHVYVCGDAESMALIRRHHEEVRKLLASTATGQEVSTAGDSFFIVFATPSEAVMFALKWQDLTRRLAEAEQVPIQNRIGIHVGEVVADTHKVAGKEIDFNGIQVDTAARIMSLAQGNQVLLSKFAFENAQQMLEGMEISGIGHLTWKAYGLYEVKGVKNPLEIFEVGETGFAPLRAPQDTEKAKRVSRT